MGSLLSKNSEIQDIYLNYKPAVNNLFEVEIYEYTSKDYTSNKEILGTASRSTSDTSDPLNGETLYDYGKYHITGVTLSNEEGITLQRHKVTKKFYLDNSPYTLFDTVSLTWREDADFKVRKFHENWLKLFYDREKDCFISSDKNMAYLKFKEIHIKFPEDTLVLKKVLPKNIPALNSFAWGNSPSVISYTLTYYVESWYWLPRVSKK